MKKRILRVFILIFLGIGFGLGYYFLWIFDPILAPIYDQFTKQSHPTTIKKVQSNYKSFETVSFEELPEYWQKNFQSKNIRVCSKLRNDKFYKKQKFLKINNFDRYKFLVGNLRVKDFLSKDRLIKTTIRNPQNNEILFQKNSISIPNLKKVQYLLLDEKLLFKIQKLHSKLRQRKLNPYAFRVNSGFRPPFYNHLIGGKSCSRHQFGDAIDISIRDVNQDGEIDKKDKQIFYKTLQQIIGNQGGLGIYKSSFRTIHFDTRGHRARWNY